MRENSKVEAKKITQPMAKYGTENGMNLNEFQNVALV